MAFKLRSGGFTLAEVLVALVVLSILSGLAWRGVDGMIRTQEAVEAQRQRAQAMSTALAQWEQDLQHVLAVGPVPTLHFDGARLRILRRTAEGVRLVVWSLRDGMWQRWADQPSQQEVTLAQAWARVPQMQGREAGTLTLAEGVSGWQLYFFRAQGWSNAQSSGDLAAEPPAPEASGAMPPQNPARERLPQGVRMVMTVGGAWGSGTLTRDVLVAASQP